MVARENGLPSFPYDFPGTIGYAQYFAARLSEIKAKWSRRPIGKRINYAKCGIPNFFDDGHYHSILSGDIAAKDIREDHVVRVFVQTEGRGVPEEGSRIYTGPNDLSPIGYITSGGYSQTLGKGIGFGAVRSTSIIHPPESADGHLEHLDNQSIAGDSDFSDNDTIKTMKASKTWYLRHLDGPLRPCTIRRV
jgi:hypothetical protein